MKFVLLAESQRRARADTRPRMAALPKFPWRGKQGAQSACGRESGPAPPDSRVKARRTACRGARGGPLARRLLQPGLVDLFDLAWLRRQLVAELAASANV